MFTSSQSNTWNFIHKKYKKQCVKYISTGNNGRKGSTTGAEKFIHWKCRDLSLKLSERRWQEIQLRQYPKPLTWPPRGKTTGFGLRKVVGRFRAPQGGGGVQYSSQAAQSLHIALWTPKCPVAVQYPFPATLILKYYFYKVPLYWQQLSAGWTLQGAKYCTVKTFTGDNNHYGKNHLSKKHVQVVALPALCMCPFVNFCTHLHYTVHTFVRCCTPCTHSIDGALCTLYVYPYPTVAVPTLHIPNT
jgi:hypothetical protein